MDSSDCVRKLLTYVVIYTIGLLWSSVVLLREAFLFLRHPSEYFRVQPRTASSALREAEPEHPTVAHLSNGIDLHFVARGDPQKPLILFLHGFPEFWYSWRKQLAALSADYYCVAVDLRGYGDSSKPAGENNYVVDELLTDIRLLVSEHFKLQKFTLVGHDWGGLLAWTFADVFPQLLERLIIINCPHPLAVVRGGCGQALRSWYMFLFQLPLLPELMMRRRDMENLELMYKTVPGIGAADIEAYKYTFGKRSDSFTYPVNYYRANMKPVLARLLGLPRWLSTKTEPHTEAKVVRRWWRSECFDRDSERQNIASEPWRPLDVPTLMIWGVTDKFIKREFAQISGEYCNNYRCVMVQDAGHWVPQERPDEVNKLISDFMKNSDSF